MVKQIGGGDESARSKKTAVGRQLSSIIRLLFLVALFFMALVFMVTALRAQDSNSPASSILADGSTQTIDTPLPDAPSAPIGGRDKAQTQKDHKNSVEQNGTPPATVKPQPAVQPNVIDSFSFERLSRRSHPGPLSVGEKFAYFEKPVFGPRAVVMTAVGTGIFMANPSDSFSKYPREWLDGAGAFGRNYGDRYARNEASAFGRFSVDALLDIDPRYSRSASKSFFGRSAHAVGFTFVDKTDGGHRTLAFGNFAGAAASGFVGNAYLPNGWNDPTHAGRRALASFAGFAAENMVQEFAPEIARGFRRLHLPKLPLPPVWWTRSEFD